MKRTGILACATLAFCLLASPLAAQEAAQPVPQAEQLPPPPPFPPMPSSKPSHRWVDMGGHTSRARSKATPARHHASPVKSDRKARSSSKARASHKANKGSKATASHRTVHKEKAMHFSAKTIRSCHAMTYRQIIRNSSCRTMIKQELAAAAPKHRTSHKVSARRATHHGTAAHSKTVRRHSTAKRRSR
jgi:hypothetical protein